MADAGPLPRAKIVAHLLALEARHGVRIVYACEGGSRGHGVQTASSDYDVRFIYVRPPCAYLSVRDTRAENDVIQGAAGALLDGGGWDVRKALLLLRASNPGLLEYLGSPVVYRGFEGDGVDDGVCAAEMRRIARAHFSSSACMHHYYGWLMSKYGRNCEDGSLKRFFYVLRPVLAMRFLEKGRGIVPTLFDELVDGALDCGVEEEKMIADACKKLAQDRRDGRDPAGEQHMKRLTAFVHSEAKRFKGMKFPVRAKEKVSFEVLDRLFSKTLANVWKDEGDSLLTGG